MFSSIPGILPLGRQLVSRVRKFLRGVVSTSPRVVGEKEDPPLSNRSPQRATVPARDPVLASIT